MTAQEGLREASQLSPALYAAAYSLVTAHHAQYDPSHDVHHVQRVHALSIRIAKSLPQPINFKVVALASLFHDLLDKKYLPKGRPIPTALAHLEDVFWRTNDLEQEEVCKEERELVARVVENVSYSKEVKRVQDGKVTEWEKDCEELKCVQDADKLDAMGAFGIMRCSAYSAITSRPLYLPASNSATPPPDHAIQHFHDKLFRLSVMLKTPLGQKLGEERDKVMKAFVAAVEKEYAEACGV